ncbi:MAG TPA: polysaccharide biosynthesis protein [Marmoricola sp.]|nr:polysaccharide biosynthesis protein [Marmoricola sp.]HMY08007.1 polysaccharide biosynthesis protein [Marmoricola sp.]
MSEKARASSGLGKQVESGGMVIAVAMAIMNVTTYGYQMVAARLLGPVSYSGFAALMNLLLVVTVLALALQANAARRIATEPADVHSVEAAVIRVGRQAAFGLALIALIGAPLINYALQLNSLATALLVGLSALPLTLVGAQLGVLQGERRWRSLAVVYLASGLPRLAIGTTFLVIDPTTFWAILGVMVGAWAPVFVGAMALRRPRDQKGTTAATAHTAGALWRETLQNTLVLLGYFALTSADALIARNSMDHHEAGLYAAGLIMTKAVLFMPQFIVVIAFPSLGASERPLVTLFKALAAVLTIGIVMAVAAKVMSGFALVFTGGPKYGAIEDSLWKFAILGAMLALLQLLVYGLIARRSKFSIYLVWVALAALVYFGQLAGTFTEMVNTVMAINAVLLFLLLILSIRGFAKQRPDQASAALSV